LLGSQKYSKSSNIVTYYYSRSRDIISFPEKLNPGSTFHSETLGSFDFYAV